MFGKSRSEKIISSSMAERGTQWLQSRKATWTFIGFSFAESLFAPVIIDPFLIAIILASPKKWKWYVMLSIIASTIGGVGAYILGALFFDTIGIKIINFYSIQSSFAMLSDNLNDSGFLVVFIGAFTPIPYKLVAITSGVLHIDFITFIVASIFGRTMRLGLVGYATHLVGPKALPLVRKNMYRLAFTTGVLVVGYFTIQFFIK